MKATEMILKHLEAIDKEPDHPEAASGKKEGVKDEEDTFDDLTLFDVSKDEEDQDSINASSTSAAGVPGQPSIFDNSDFGKLL